MLHEKEPEEPAVLCQYCVGRKWHHVKSMTPGYIQAPSGGHVEVTWCPQQWSDYHRIINLIIKAQKESLT